MLKEAEARGFVEKDTHDIVFNGTQPAYLTSGMGRISWGLMAADSNCTGAGH